jgi:hypothetical protein
MTKNPYQADIETILAKRHDNGGDYWATPEGHLIKGSPFTTLDCACMLADLGMSPDDPVMQNTAGLIFSAQREDGRFRLSPKGAIYPCQTINALRTLCLRGIPVTRGWRKRCAPFKDSASRRRLALQQIQLRPRTGN